MSVETLYEVRVKQAAMEILHEFARNFGESAYNLAIYSSLPIGLTPELVHLLRINFVEDAPWMAEADLLLSPLCREAGGDLYIMDESAREILLEAFKFDPLIGHAELMKAAEFLYGYAERNLPHAVSGIHREMLSTQRWAALAYLDPAEAAHSIATAMQESLESGDMGGTLKAARVARMLTEPMILERDILVYASGVEKYLQGDIEAADEMLYRLQPDSQTVEVAGVFLPSPRRLRARLQPASGMQKFRHEEQGPRRPDIMIFESEDGRGKPLISELTRFLGNRFNFIHNSNSQESDFTDFKFLSDTKESGFTETVDKRVGVCQRLIFIVSGSSERRFTMDQWGASWSHAKEILILSPDSPPTVMDMVMQPLFPKPLFARVFAKNNPRWQKDVEAELAKPIKPLGALIAVPELPGFFHRTDKLIEFVLELGRMAEESKGGMESSPGHATLLLTGPGGSGKTVLASAACRTGEIRRAFPGGIYWMTGWGGDGIYQSSVRRVGGNPAFTPRELLDSLRPENGRYLLVLDCDSPGVAREDCEFLAGIIDPGAGNLLLISRNRTGFSNSSTHVLSSWPKEECIRFLRTALPHLPQSTDDLIRFVSQLHGTPLELTLVVRFLREFDFMGKHPSDESVVAERKLLQRWLEEFRNTVEAGWNSTASIETAIRVLDIADLERLWELAVFPTDTNVPERELRSYWMEDKGYVDACVKRFSSLGLISRERNECFQIHSTVKKVLEDRAGTRLRRYHEKFLEIWGDFPYRNEPYRWNFIGYHLAGADHLSRLRESLFEYRFLEAKMNFASLESLLADFNRFPQDPAIARLRELFEKQGDWVSKGLTTLPALLADGIEAGSMTELLALKRAAESMLAVPEVPPTRETSHPFAKEAVVSLAVADHGKTAFSVSRDGRLTAWDIKSGKTLATRILDGYMPRSLAVAASEDIVAVGLESGEIMILDAIKLESIAQLQSRDPVTALAFHHNENGLLSGNDSGDISSWDFRSGKQRSKNVMDESIGKLEFSPRGDIVFAKIGISKIGIWKLNMLFQTDTLLSKIESGPHARIRPILDFPPGIAAARFSRDGKEMLIGTYDGALYRIPVHANSDEGRRETSPGNSLTSVAAIGPEGSFLVTANEYAAKMWSPDGKRLLHKFPPQNGKITALALSPDGSVAIIGLENGRVEFFSVPLESLTDLRVAETFDRNPKTETSLSEPEYPGHPIGPNYADPGIVSFIQRHLNRHELFIFTDGAFGAETEKAVKAFQAKLNRLVFSRNRVIRLQLRTGVVDEPTWMALTGKKFPNVDGSKLVWMKAIALASEMVEPGPESIIGDVDSSSSMKRAKEAASKISESAAMKSGSEDVKWIRKYFTMAAEAFGVDNPLDSLSGMINLVERYSRKHDALKLTKDSMWIPYPILLKNIHLAFPGSVIISRNGTESRLEPIGLVEGRRKALFGILRDRNGIFLIKSLQRLSQVSGIICPVTRLTESIVYSDVSMSKRSVNANPLAPSGRMGTLPQKNLEPPYPHLKSEKRKSSLTKRNKMPKVKKKLK